MPESHTSTLVIYPLRRHLQAQQHVQSQYWMQILKHLQQTNPRFDQQENNLLLCCSLYELPKQLFLRGPKNKRQWQSNHINLVFV